MSNPRSNGTLFQRTDFIYQPLTDTYLCRAAKTLRRKATRVVEKRIDYIASESDCGACSLRPQCTGSAKVQPVPAYIRGALDRLQARVTPALTRLRRSTGEHPFSTIKYRILGHPRLLLRGRNGTRIEIGLAVMDCNRKRMMNLLGTLKLTE